MTKHSSALKDHNGKMKDGETAEGVLSSSQLSEEQKGGRHTSIPPNRK